MAGSFVTAGLPLLAPLWSPADLAGSIPFFDSSKIEAVSFIADSTNTATLEPEPVVKSDEQPIAVKSDKETALFGMETEPLAGGTISEKWSRAKTDIAWELEAVERCRANDACPADAQKLLDL